MIVAPCKGNLINIGLSCPYRAKAYNVDRPRALPWAGINCHFRALHKGLALLVPQCEVLKNINSIEVRNEK